MVMPGSPHTARHAWCVAAHGRAQWSSGDGQARGEFERQRPVPSLRPAAAAVGHRGTCREHFIGEGLRDAVEVRLQRR